MRTFIRIFAVLIFASAAGGIAFHLLKPIEPPLQKQSNLDLENKLNAARDAKKAGSRAKITAVTQLVDRSPASTGQVLQRNKTSYLILADYRAVPNQTTKNSSLVPQARINGFAVYKNTQNNEPLDSLVVKNQRTGRYGIFTKRFKVRFENESALEELKRDPRLQVETVFEPIAMAFIRVKDQDFNEVKASLEKQSGIISVDFEIIEHRPGVGK